MLAARPPAAELTPTDVEQFLDEFFDGALEEHEVPGAGILVVAEGAVVGARGYGLADRETGRPVVAERTVFPAQSVSKLFAATAVMQLVERGEIDLGQRLREALPGVPWQNDFAEPVEIGHLLTHTAGFDDSYLGFLPRHADDRLSVPEYLDRYPRRVIFRPGTVHAYSNYSSLLARRVIEVADGRQYEQYLLDELVRPLGMNDTTVLPPPPDWLERFATGYLPGHDGLESTRDVFPDGLVRFRMPTGTLASTVVDMAPFLIAHLEGGTFDGRTMLSPETVETMHRQQFAQDPVLPGATYGFFETATGGHRGLLHFGSGFGYGAFLYLMPEARVGLYLAHSNSASRVAEALLVAFLERYYPTDPPSQPPAAPEADLDAQELAGYYVPARRNESTFERLPLTLAQGHLRAGGPDTLENDQILPRTWRRADPLHYQRSDGRGDLAFALSDTGRPDVLAAWDDELPQLLVLQRLPWYDTTPLLAARITFFLLLHLGVVFVAPIGAWRRRRRGVASAAAEARFRRALTSAAGLYLAFLAGFVWIFAAQQFVYSVSPLMIGIFTLPLLAAVGTAFAGWTWIRHRLWPDDRRLSRFVPAGVLVGQIAFLLFLARWNLLGYQF